MSQEELQQEFDTIDAIYPEYLERLSETQCVLKIPDRESISIHLSFPTGYPTEAAPQVLQVNGVQDSRALREQFQTLMNTVWVQDVCIFDFLGEVTEICSQLSDEELALSHKDTAVDSTLQQLESLDLDSEPAPAKIDWFQSDPVVDRGSTFVAFAAHVTSEEDACQKLA